MGNRIGKLNLHKASGCHYVRIDGHMKYITKKGECRDAAELALAKIRLELNEPEDKTKTPDDQQISLLASTYLDKVKGIGTEKNYIEKTRYINSFVSRFGERPIKTLLPIELQDWIASLPSRTSGGGQRNAYGHVAAFFNWCNKMLDTTSLPHKRVTPPERNVRGEEYVMSKDEYTAILPLLKQPYRDVAVILWESGARPSEIIDADISEYIASKKIIHKVNHKTKHKGHQRVIVLTDTADEIIRQHIGERTQGRIFLTNKGKPLNERWMHESFVSGAREIGRTKPTVLYSLRHSFAVRQLERLIPINIVAGWLGHSIPVCERHYAHTIARLSTQRHLLA